MRLCGGGCAASKPTDAFDEVSFQSGPATAEEPAPDVAEGLANWLVAKGVIAQLSDALVLGCSAPGGLQSVDAVRRALRAQLDRLAGIISHQSTMAQAAGCAAVPSAKMPTADTIDIRVRWLMNVNAARLIAVALEPVLIGGGHSFDLVRDALDGCVDMVAASISHGAVAAISGIPWPIVSANAEANARVSMTQGMA